MKLSKAPIDTALAPELGIIRSKPWFLWLGALVRAVNDASPLNGSATFASSNTLTVTFDKQEPDTDYRVTISVNANETVWVTNKAKTGFTLNSSKTNSTATVDWMRAR